jgi:hypothetical protein
VRVWVPLEVDARRFRRFRRFRHLASAEHGALRRGKGRPEAVLVGVEQHAFLIVVARTAVGLEREDVGAHQGFHRGGKRQRRARR